MNKYNPPIISEKKRKKAQNIVEQSCQILNVPKNEFFSPTQVRRLSDARHMISSVLFFNYGLSTEEISQVIGRHRTTINHSLEMSRNLCTYNQDFKEQLEELKQSLK